MSTSSAMTLDTFEELVEEALLTLPEEINGVMENVVVTVAEHPSAAQRRATGLGPGQALYGL